MNKLWLPIAASLIAIISVLSTGGCTKINGNQKNIKSTLVTPPKNFRDIILNIKTAVDGHHFENNDFYKDKNLASTFGTSKIKIDQSGSKTTFFLSDFSSVFISKTAIDESLSDLTLGEQKNNSGEVISWGLDLEIRLADKTKALWPKDIMAIYGNNWTQEDLGLQPHAVRLPLIMKYARDHNGVEKEFFIDNVGGLFSIKVYKMGNCP